MISVQNIPSSCQCILKISKCAKIESTAGVGGPAGLPVPLPPEAAPRFRFVGDP